MHASRTAGGTAVTIGQGAQIQPVSRFPPANTVYRIQSRHSGKVLEVGGLSRVNGGTMNIWGDANVHQQHWAVTPVGGGYFTLTNRLSQRVLEVPGGSTADGTVLDQWDHDGAGHQHWQLIRS